MPERRTEITGRVEMLPEVGGWRTIYDEPITIYEGEEIQEDVNFETFTVVARIKPHA